MKTVTNNQASPRRAPIAIPLWVRLTVGPVLAALLIAVMAADVFPRYITYSIALACVYAIIVMSVGLLAGWNGVWSVGQPAMVAIGAYAAAYGSKNDWSVEFTVVVAMGLAAICGALLGFAGSRFSTLYIALLTLAFNLVGLEVINHWVSVTGGDEGTSVSSLDSITGTFTIDSGGEQIQYLAIAALGIWIAIATLARRSALRMRLAAAKSHVLAARSVGISPEGQTSLAFATSAAVAAFGGVLLALLSGFVSAEVASLVLGINLIAATVFGGVGLVTGAVLGGIFMAWSPTLAGDLGISQPILQGAILILALLVLPSGVAAPVLRALRRLLRLASADWVRPAIAPEDTTTPSDPATRPAEPAAGTDRPDSAGTILAVDDITVRFGGLTALSGVSVEVVRGEVLAVIGPNGAGKTTFLNVLSGLLPSRNVSGAMLYRGAALPAGRAVRRSGLGIARTFQHAEMFGDLTVLQNLLCGRRRATPADVERAWSVLHDLDLASVANSFPADLPFGVQKRADLARAVYSSPELLLMDEPFGGLDDHERRVMADAIRRLRDNGLTMVIIDHVLDDLRAGADRFLAFDFGTPIAAGSAEVVLADEQVRAAYLGTGGAAAHEPNLPAELAPVLQLRHVDFGYSGVLAIHGLDLQIYPGRINGIVGANGAGKSTTGKLLHGLVTPGSGSREVTAGAVRVSLVPEGRALFRTLSIAENLEVAAYAAGLTRAEVRAQLVVCQEWLPVRLRDRMDVSAGSLSGGEQQMVAIARALMARPDVMILDEPALGLAPTLVDEVYGRIAELARGGMTIVLLEQLLSRVIAASDHVVVLRDGRN